MSASSCPIREFIDGLPGVSTITTWQPAIPPDYVSDLLSSHQLGIFLGRVRHFLKLGMLRHQQCGTAFGIALSIFQITAQRGLTGIQIQRADLISAVQQADSQMDSRRRFPGAALFVADDDNCRPVAVGLGSLFLWLRHVYDSITLNFYDRRISKQNFPVLFFLIGLIRIIVRCALRTIAQTRYIAAWHTLIAFGAVRSSFFVRSRRAGQPGWARVDSLSSGRTIFHRHPEKFSARRASS